MQQLVIALKDNQYIVETPNLRLFQSYKTIICVSDKIAHKVYVNSTFYSTTTSKYKNEFLRDYVGADWERIELSEDKFEKQLSKLRMTRLF